MEYKGIEVKTMKGWEEFATSPDKGGFEHYCKPGELVDESVFDYFLNVLPPHRWDKDYLQAGEPYSFAFNPEKGKQADTWNTFKRIDKGVYMYLGDCFTGGFWDGSVFQFKTVAEFLEKTFRVNPAVGMQETRPRIFCKDGFSISVQGGEALYSHPRRNGKKFEAVECGFPSQAEELLMEYAEERRKPKDTVYPYVPLDVVEKVIEKHGGPA